jgi:hypothetical protein
MQIFSLFSRNQSFSGMPELKIISKGVEYICGYDQSDEQLVSKFKWHFCNGYAVSKINGRTVKMHRLIMDLIDPSIQVDHKDHDRLNNHRANLRTCTPAQNLQNSRKTRGLSKFKGVYRDGFTWKAQINNDQKRVNIGRFRSEITAAKVYDRAAREIYREFANPNFKDSSPEAIQLTII